MKLIYLLSGTFISLVLHGSSDQTPKTLSDAQKRLIKRYKMPSPLKDFFKNRNIETITQSREIGGYYVKPDAYSRLVGKEYFDTIIKKHNLDLLFTPQKYIYHAPGSSKNDIHNYYVVAKKVNIQGQTPIKNGQFFNTIPDNQLQHYREYTLPQAKQLCDFVEKSRYDDLCLRNMGYVNGKICLFDTEARIRQPGQFGKLCALEHLYANTQWTSDAQQYVHRRYRDRRAKYEIEEWLEAELQKKDRILYQEYLKKRREKMCAYFEQFKGCA